MKSTLRSLVIIIIGMTIITGCVRKSDYDELDAMVELNKSIISEQTELILELEVANKELALAEATLLEALEADISDVDLIESEVIESEASVSSSSSASLISMSQTVIELIRDEDFVTLSSYIHPTNGVRFTPYSYVDSLNDQVFTALEMSTFGTTTTPYLWGNYDGSGDPINVTQMAYFDEFVYDEDYATPHLIGVNTPVGVGNMINNVSAEYPTADYVEYHFTGFNATYAGMDWSSLTLVYEQVGVNWYLVGVVHSQWTT